MNDRAQLGPLQARDLAEYARDLATIDRRRAQELAEPHAPVAKQPPALGPLGTARRLRPLDRIALPRREPDLGDDARVRPPSPDGTLEGMRLRGDGGRPEERGEHGGARHGVRRASPGPSAASARAAASCSLPEGTSARYVR